MAINIGPKIGIDGEAQFRKEINNLVQASKTLDSAMKAVTSSFDDNDNSQEKLTAQSEILTKQIDNQRKRIELLQEGLDAASKKYGEADSNTQKWEQAVNDAYTSLNKMQRELQDVTTAMNSADGATDDLDASMDNLADSAGDAGVSFDDLLGANLIADGIGKIAESIGNVAEETKEYRKIMASLEVSSEKAGYTAEQTSEAYQELYGVLADDQTAATTTANLQALGFEQSELMDVIDATIGAWATYGDSIPIDSLSEAINETIKTGTVTGTFADVLNWAGTSEDEFNKQLQSTNDTTERAQIVMDELANQGLMDAGKAWKENNETLVEANKATASQQEALAELGETVEPVLTSITELTTAFIKTILENKTAVIAGVAGIGGAFAAWKITDKLKEVNSGFDTLKNLVSGNPVGAAISGFSLLTGAGVALVSMLADTDNAMNQIITRSEEMKDRLKESVSDLETSIADAEQSFDDIGAASEVAEDVAGRLEELANKTNRTAGEQAEMAGLVSQLNTLFPDMGLAIDEVTGNLNMSSDAIDDFVKNSANLAQAKAAQDKLAAASEELVDAQVELYNTGQELEDMEDRRIEIEEELADISEAVTKKQQAQEQAQIDYNEALKTGEGDLTALYNAMMDTSEAVVEYNGQTMTASEASKLLNDELSTLKAQQESLQGTYDTQNEKVEESKGKINELSEAYEDLNSQTSTNTETKSANNEVIDYSITKAGEELAAFQQLDEGMQIVATDVANAVMGMQSAVQNAVQSQMDIFSQFEYASEVSKDEILGNMQSQIDGFNSWGEQLSQLATETKTTSDGLQVTIDQGLLQYLAEMGPEGAGYVAAFNQMTGDELAKANELWSQSIDIQGMKTEWGQQLEQGVGELAAGGKENFNQLAEQLNLSTNADGVYVVQGLVDGMLEAKKQAEDASEEVGLGVLESLDSSLGVASPSTKAKASGIYVDAGLSEGMNSSRMVPITTAGHLADDVIDELISGLNVNLVRSYGRNLADSLAAGIRAGQSEVIRSAAEMAQSAITAAQNKLEIHSPSHVFVDMGENSADAYGIGLENRRKELLRTVAGTMDMSGIAASIGPAEITGNSRTVTYGDNIINIYATPNQSEDQIADLVMYKIQHRVEQEEAAF